MNKLTIEDIANAKEVFNLKRIIESLPVRYLLLDSKGKILTCSSQASDTIFGVQPSELIGQYIFDFKFITNENEIKQIKQKIAVGEKFWQLKINLLSADGNSREYIFLAESFRTDSGEKFFNCVFLETTLFLQYLPELKQESALLNVFLNYLPDEVFFKDSNLNYIKVNNSRAFALGLNSPAEAVGKNDYQFFPEEIASEFEQEERELLNSGRTIFKEEQRPSPQNGSPKWYQVTKGILPCPTGKSIGIFGICRDITNVKATREKNLFLIKFQKALSQIANTFLREKGLDSNKGIEYSLYKMAKLLGSNFAMFFSAKIDGSFQMENKWVREGFQLEGNGIQNIYSKFLQVIPNFNSRSFNFNKIMLQYLNGALTETEVQILTKNNPFIISLIVEGEIYGYIVFGENKLPVSFLEENIYLFNIFSEIISNALENYELEKQRTALESEMQKLLRAVEQSANLIAITDVELKIEYANSTFLTKTDFNLNEIYGEKLSEFFSFEKPNSYTLKEQFTISLNEGKNWSGKLKCRKKNEKSFWAMLNISPIKNNEGKITNYIAVAEDISEKILLENQLAIAQKLESIGQLAAGIAHEINSPLQYIGDNTLFAKDSVNHLINFINDVENLLREKDADLAENFKELKKKYDLDFLLEELPVALAQTNAGIAKVDKIVRAMKNFAHPGKKEKSRYNLNKGIEYAITISKNAWKYVAELLFEPDENLPEVYCQLDEINQVILNMIINAAQAIEDKLGKRPGIKGLIRISTSRKGEYAVIKIEDNGCGIPEENLQKIFDPFFTTKEVGRGTGQGLSIAYDIIVNKHNGMILVDSDPGKGSTFTIQIPINEEKEYD